MQEKLFKTLGQTGAGDITIGILCLIGGVVLGVLSIVNGARCLNARKKLMI